MTSSAERKKKEFTGADSFRGETITIMLRTWKQVDSHGAEQVPESLHLIHVKRQTES